MAEIAIGGIFVCALWGFIDICRRIKNFVRPPREKPKDNIEETKNGKKVASFRFSESEIAEIFIKRIEKNPRDKQARSWLESHGYTEQ
jgi:hypothetical protein